MIRNPWRTTLNIDHQILQEGQNPEAAQAVETKDRVPKSHEDGHFYSVPWELAHEVVDVVLTIRRGREVGLTLSRQASRSARRSMVAERYEAGRSATRPALTATPVASPEDRLPDPDGSLRLGA